MNTQSNGVPYNWNEQGENQPRKESSLLASPSELIDMVQEIIFKCADLTEKDFGKKFDAMTYAMLTRIDCELERMKNNMNNKPDWRNFN